MPRILDKNKHRLKNYGFFLKRQSFQIARKKNATTLQNATVQLRQQNATTVRCVSKPGCN
jgi:hypothetical protein